MEEPAGVGSDALIPKELPGKAALQEPLKVALAMQNSNNFDRCFTPVHDHVLINAKEENIAVGEVGTFMALSWKIGQGLESIHQFSLDAVGDLQARLDQ